MVGLCFANAPYVGYDPSIITDKHGCVKSIKCCGKEFNVVHTIYETQSLVGRATRVWEVEYMGKEFILKDAWVEKARPVSEIQHLEHISGVRGVPELYCGEDVMMDGKVFCTGDIRGTMLPTMRIRRRIVTSSVGSHIADFHNKRELISAFRDIVITLKTLANEKDTVHRDVSYSNILLSKPKTDTNDVENKHRRGLLIDFEYAARLSEEYAMTPGLRTGTLPFMSIELLISRLPVFHKARHDLESVFFVFIYLCTNLSGPQVPRPLHELQELRSLPIASWFNPASSMERLGADKLSAMALIDQRIIPYFSEYFEDLKPCALDLYRAIYPSLSSLVQPTDISHDAIIRIFDNTLENLPEVDSLPIVSLRTPRVRKRSLGIHDNSIKFGTQTKKKRKPSNPSSSGIHSSTGSRSIISASSSLGL
jgi:serine/threonine protein kinase